MKVTISHPHGNPNSNEAARGFCERGWLCDFHTGFARLEGAAFAKTSIKRHFLWQTASALGRRLRPSGLTSSVSWYDVMFCGHDSQVSRRLDKNPDVVYAYEDGARQTFEVALKQRVARVYELPAGYYLGVAKEIERAVRRSSPMTNPQVSQTPSWKMARKDKELDLADLVIVPSKWALKTLRFSKAGAKRVLKIPYGTPADDIQVRTKRPSGPFSVLFAGKIGMRKGVPLLIEAWTRLGLPNAQLLLAGPMKVADGFLNEQSNIQYLGALHRLRLLEVMKTSDLFVFPSLADGFGLVIGEAMSAGVPVLTTTNTGGPELITNGQEGWCVPSHDIDALVERIEWAYQNRDALYEMGVLARKRAEQWTWADYRRSLTSELSRHLGI